MTPEAISRKEDDLGGNGLSAQRPDCLYNAVFGIKKEDIGHENTYPWNINSVFSRR